MDFIVEGFFRAFRLLMAGDPETFSAVSATLRVSSYSMVLSLTLGIPVGFLLGYFEFTGKKSIRMVVDTLLALPTVLVGLIVYAFLTYRGPLGKYEMLFTLPGIAMGQTLLALPVVIALTATAIESLDAQLRVALITLGAGRLRMFITTLREARFAVLAGAVTAYGRVMTEVGISMMVGGNIKWHTRTITTAIALETNKGQFGMGVALGLVLMFVAFMVNFSVSFLKRK